MQDSDIKKIWKKSEMELYIHPGKKADSLKFLQKKIREKELPAINETYIKQMISRQILYMDKRFFVLHFTGNFLMFLFLLKLEKNAADPKNVYEISMILSILMGMFSMAAPTKLISSNLAELSKSCYFDLQQIIAFDMVVSGGINLITFLIIIPFVGFKWQVSLLCFGMYLLVPYVFTQSCCLGLLLTETGRTKPNVIIFAGAVLIVIALAAASFPDIYEASALSYWVFVFLAGCGNLFFHIRNFFTAIKKGECICTH